MKINQQYYQDEALQKALKSFPQKHFSGRNLVFQQDSAPAHCTRKTFEWFRAENIAFISVDKWSANSPDINLMEFSICGILKAKVLDTSHQNLDGLKAKLIKEETSLHGEVLHASVHDVPKRLRA